MRDLTGLSPRVTAWVALVAVVCGGCSTTGGEAADVGVTDGKVGDAMADLVADAGPELAADAGPDLVADAGPELVADVGADVAADAEVQAGDIEEDVPPLGCDEDGICDPDEDCESCPEDCECVVCEGPGEFVDCWGTGCALEEMLGNGFCDPNLDCEEFDFDGGDCACCHASPEPGCASDELVNDCVCGMLPECCETEWGAECVEAAFFDCALYCVGVCGDGICLQYGESFCDGEWCVENCISCPEDCECPECEEGLVLDCDGYCSDAEAMGNGQCDWSFNCETHGFDGGDCCPPGTQEDCFGECSPNEWLGDGTCHDAFNCEQWELDFMDCLECGDGICLDGWEHCDMCPADCGECDGPHCGDGVCDAENEDCDTCWADCYPCECPEGMLFDCTHECIYEADTAEGLGNGWCEPWLDCEEFDWDGGDCCPGGGIEDCYDGCLDESQLGDGICDPGFNCSKFNWDDQDCVQCGDGICHELENCVDCQDDCGLCESNCCLEHTDEMSCDDLACVVLVCKENLSCCQEWGWSEACAALAQELCEEACPGDGPICGDGSCSEEEDCWVCSKDCGKCQCPPGAEKDCDNKCAALAKLGDGSCDESFNCEEFEWDGGDCAICDDGICNPLEGCASCPEDCGTCPEGACCMAKAEPGCTDAACEAAVCGELPFCCAKAWDHTCVKKAQALCPACADPAPYCGDYVCSPPESLESCPVDCPPGVVPVCGDGDCQEEEDCETCPDDCGWCLQGMDCCEAHEEPGCSDEVCPIDICNDPEMAYCCTETWDEACAALAQQWCPQCFGEPYCGDGICDESEHCSSCSKDCGFCGDCPPGQTEDCEGGCSPTAWSGDGICDQVFDCMWSVWDDGDCVVCGDGICTPWPFEETCASCPEDCCAICGDGECSEGLENCASCPVDCGECTEGDCCAEHDEPGCEDAACAQTVCVADPYCCEVMWDLLCAQAALLECPVCEGVSYCGDWVCSGDETCESCEQDCGLCSCPAGQVLTCDGFGCVPEEEIGNGSCDGALNCEEHQFDGGDCCPPETQEDCLEGCSPSSMLGDGSCDEVFDCEEFLWDKLDCVVCGDEVCKPDFESCESCPADCGDCDGPHCGDFVCDLETEDCITCWADCQPCGCPDLQIFDCNHECKPIEVLGTGFCDPFFDCEELDWDGGDCCPDGGIEDCLGGCTPAAQLGDGECDEALNCEAFQFDGTDCIECGDGVCSEFESCMSCGEDCGICYSDCCFAHEVEEDEPGCDNQECLEAFYEVFPNLPEMVEMFGFWDQMVAGLAQEFCPEICPGPVCGDGSCGGDESCESCPNDCC